MKQHTAFLVMIVVVLILAVAGSVVAQDAGPTAVPDIHLTPTVPRPSTQSLPQPRQPELLSEHVFSADPEFQNADGGPIQIPDGLWNVPADAAPQSRATFLSPQERGGPDDYGYTWNGAIPLNWIDISDGMDTGIDGNTDRSGLIDIGFPFKFYENTYEQLYVSRYGYLAFNDLALWNAESRIPSPEIPNDIIAPHWTRTTGVNGYVRYKNGGILPHRWFAVEWNRLLSNTNENTFQVILYENGTILFQYGAMAGRYWCNSSGIEDSMGLDGLTITPWCRAIEGHHAVEITRPSPSARVSVYPLHQGALVHAGETHAFEVLIRNTGELGDDTYDITTASIWPAMLYAADGTTPLADTDGDGTADTGPVSEGGNATIVVKFSAPAGAVVGNHNKVTVTIRSSRNTVQSKVASLRIAVPAAFAQAYRDDTDGEMNLYLAQPAGQAVRKATNDRRYGDNLAIAETPDNDFVYVWTKGRCLTDDCSAYGREIEYTLVDFLGEVNRPATRLTNHTGTTVSTYDYPAVSVAPNGNTGMVWYRYLYDSSTGQEKFNIYYAILNPQGDLISGPTNVTNNDLWDNGTDLNIPRFYDPRIAATDDNRFILSWTREHEEADGLVTDIWFSVIVSNGAIEKTAEKLTDDTPGWDDGYFDPSLTRLSGNRALLTFSRRGDPEDIGFMVLNSNGSVAKSITRLTNDRSWDWGADTAQLSDGRIVVAYTSEYPQNPGEQSWTASYYNNETLSGPPALVRTESTIDSRWDIGSPNPAVNPDFFSARWEGTLNMPGEGSYTFNMGSDDGSKLWIDGQLIMDYWDVCCEYWQATVPLTVGAHQMKMEMHEHDGAAWAYLSWRKEGGNVIKYTVLDKAYNKISGPTILENPASVLGDAYVSVTADAAGRAILTWMDYDYSYRRNLYYALVSGNGNALTPATIFQTDQTSSPYLFTSFEGYGNTSYSWRPAQGVDGLVSIKDSWIGGPPGGEAVINVHYANQGATTASTPVLTLTLDGNLAYLSDSLGIVPTISGNNVSWNLPDLNFLNRNDFSISVQVASSSPLGNRYPVTLTLTSDGPEANPSDNTDSKEVAVTRQLFLPLVFKDRNFACLTTPTLLAPPDGSHLETLIPLFMLDGSSAPDTTSLRVWVAKDVDFTDLYWSLGTGGNIGRFQFRPFSNFEPGTTFYWRAWLQCGDVAGPYTPTWSFTTGSGGTILPAPTLLAPADDSTGISMPVTLSWSAVDGAEEYLISWRRVGQGGRSVNWTTTTEMENRWLEPDTIYEWWVAARNDYAIGDESEAWRFTTPSEATSASHLPPPQTLFWVEEDNNVNFVRKERLIR